MATNVPSPLVPTREAAAFLGVRPQTLDNWRCSRRVQIPFVRCGRKIMYKLADLEAFIAARTVNTTTPAMA